MYSLEWTVKMKRKEVPGMANIYLLAKRAFTTLFWCLISLRLIIFCWNPKHQSCTVFLGVVFKNSMKLQKLEVKFTSAHFWEQSTKNFKTKINFFISMYVLFCFEFSGKFMSVIANCKAIEILHSLSEWKASLEWIQYVFLLYRPSCHVMCHVYTYARWTACLNCR